MYVRTWGSHLECQFAVMFRIVNLLSHSECQFVLTLRNRESLKHALHEDVMKDRVEDGEDSMAGPLQCTCLAESSTEMSAECMQLTAGDSEKEKAKR